ARRTRHHHPLRSRMTTTSGPPGCRPSPSAGPPGAGSARRPPPRARARSSSPCSRVHPFRRQQARPAGPCGACVLGARRTTAVRDLVVCAREHVEVVRCDQPPRLAARQRFPEGDDPRPPEPNEARPETKAQGNVVAAGRLGLVRLPLERCRFDNGTEAQPLALAEEGGATTARGPPCRERAERD